QKLPMWGEVFGWSLIVSNALALPLMNLAGVLLEGSLRRDAAGILSFVGLSWLLVPFQAYASLKALFERDEGGWVRTPKSGRVTAALLAFALGLSVNVVFLANAVPADASAGTSSTFYLSDAKTTFACAGAYDMYQTAPTAAGSFSFPGGAGVKDTFCSDTFTTGMALGAGTTSNSVYMWNNSTSKTCNVSFALLWYHAATATTTSLGTGSTSLA